MTTSTSQNQTGQEMGKTTLNTSNVGNVERNGLQSTRLNPREIAVKMFLINDQEVSVLDSTDEQFEAFRLLAGIPIRNGSEGEKWSFDNKCRAINHALKYGLKLPFVEQNPNKNNSETITPDELLNSHETAQKEG